jgi:hypothetical protein
MDNEIQPEHDTIMEVQFTGLDGKEYSKKMLIKGKIHQKNKPKEDKPKVKPDPVVKPPKSSSSTKKLNE